jgi:molybdenum cofactor synthesis domain-containing protein
LREIKTEQAIGMVLGHDLTKIIPGKFKGRAFKKGHIIRQQDIEELLSMGKEYIYILDIKEGELHEDDAAERLAKAIYGPNIELSETSEGKVNLSAAIDGLLKINQEAIVAMNTVADIAIATLHSNRIVKKGEKLAGTRAVPLVIDEEKIKTVETIAKNFEPVIQVMPIRSLKVGMVTTGSEVFKGRIPDAFGPVVTKKLAALGSEVVEQIFVPDDLDEIQAAVNKLMDKGVEMIITTGGMSVDPDDRTPGAIKALGAEIVTYGTPILPGSMLLLAYYKGIPVLGLPGCVMYEKSTSFDLILPRVLANEPITREDIARLGYGGLCLSCQPCTFPHCSFGK